MTRKKIWARKCLLYQLSIAYPFVAILVAFIDLYPMLTFRSWIQEDLQSAAEKLNKPGAIDFIASVADAARHQSGNALFNVEAILSMSRTAFSFFSFFSSSPFLLC